MNTKFKVKLTPKDDKAVYSQSLPKPIHLKEDLIVELTLMHNYGIITVLPSSKYAGPVVAQTKSNGKLPVLVNLRKFNSLSADSYTNNSHIVSNLTDAAQILAEDSLFCKLDCSQACHCNNGQWKCLLSIFVAELLPRTFAQGLSRPLFFFSGFMHEYLDPVVKTHQCAQYMDDIRIAVNIATELTRKIRAACKCFCQAGLKLTIEKSPSGVRQVEFPGKTISPEGMSPTSSEDPQLSRQT